MRRPDKFQLPFDLEAISTIGRRLKDYRHRTGVKMAQVAQDTNIKADLLYKWENGTIPRNVEQINTLTQYLDNMEKGNVNWRAESLAADYSNSLYKSSLVRVPIRFHRRPLPLPHAKFTVGTITYFQNEPELILHNVEMFFLGTIDGLIDVDDDAMLPALKNGSKIALVRLEDMTLLNLGQCYFIIDKNMDYLVRRVEVGESGDFITLLSDNPDQRKYPPIVRRWDQIEAVFKVKANISRF